MPSRASAWTTGGMLLRSTGRDVVRASWSGLHDVPSDLHDTPSALHD
jgi:hypothetical protein